MDFLEFVGFFDWLFCDRNGLAIQIRYIKSIAYRKRFIFLLIYVIILAKSKKERPEVC